MYTMLLLSATVLEETLFVPPWSLSVCVQPLSTCKRAMRPPTRILGRASTIFQNQYSASSTLLQTLHCFPLLFLSTFFPSSVRLLTASITALSLARPSSPPV